jgi:hypothetical protein
LEADLNRYKLEILMYRNKEIKAKGNIPNTFEADDLMKETKQLYLDTCELCESLETTNPLRLGLYLNYSCFLYEICELIEDARFILKRCFDDALKNLERLNEAEL